MVNNTGADPVVGDLVVTIIVIQNRNGAIIPAGVVGEVCGVAHGLLQVDFGEYGIKFLSPVNVDIVGHNLTEAELGETLADLTGHLIEENEALRRALHENAVLFRAPSRLVKANSSRN